MKAAWGLSKGVYVEIDADMENFDNSTIKAEIDGEEKDYTLGGGVERKLLYTNPDTTSQMTDVTMFQESEIEGYQYLCFTVTDTSGSFEVEEWCEIEPLKNHSGQFIISMPIGSKLYGRKVYRSNGAVKPSVGVYEIGKTTENRDACIIKTIECVKGV